ncbi:MAG: hypothetical protein L7F78_25235, partial [Syntrophales bacterium LBB04]|nr:hypothetical protein [Syntrophales bacterium LBB04]
MKRLDPILLKVLLCGLPLVAGLGAFSYFYSVGVVKHGGGYVGFLNSLAGLVFAVWMTLSIYLSLRLIVSGPFRDQVIAKITFIRERDEREAILTGKAAKTAFLTSLAFLILLFCLSCFHVSIYKVPLERAVDGKTGFVTLGLGFSFLEQGKQDRAEDIVKEKDIFSYSGLP